MSSSFYELVRNLSIMPSIFNYGLSNYLFLTTKMYLKQKEQVKKYLKSKKLFENTTKSVI